MIVPFNEVGAHGLIADRQSHELPLTAWSAAKNVRFRNGFVEKFLGDKSVFGAPTVAPYFVLPATSQTTFWWIYAGLQKVFATEGIAHSNITRQLAGVDQNFTGTPDDKWTGTVFGGIPILNNGRDAPQKWMPVSAATRLASLDYVTGSSTWDSVGYQAAVIRGYKNFLVALDITKNSVRFPHMVKWSHPAAPGLVPDSWNEADTTKDAGEYPLSQSNGFVVDCEVLRDANIIYKEDAVLGMQFVGGLSIFRFYPIFNQIGILARNCAVEFFSGKHAVFGNGDCVIHDGQTMQSILSNKMRKSLFDRIDGINRKRSFVAVNQKFKDIWFCYPGQGFATPNEALVWNWESNAISIRELSNVSHIGQGLVSSAAVADAWNNDPASWDSDGTAWGNVGFSLSEPDLLFAASTDTKLLRGDTTAQFDGVNMTAYVERTGLGIPPRPNEGPPDITRRKFLRAIYPRIDGAVTRSLTVQVGVQDYVAGPITWLPKMDYTIGSTRRLDLRVSGRLFAIRYESTQDFDWRLHGYDLDVDFLGAV